MSPADETKETMMAMNAEEQSFLQSLTREQLIKLCEWNDRNGCFNDEESTDEFGRPATREELEAVVVGWLTEDETAEERSATLALFRQHV